VSLRLLKSIFLLGILLALSVANVFGETSNAELLQLLPERVGSFHRAETPRAAELLKQRDVLQNLQPLGAQAEYTSGAQRFLVEIFRFHQDSEAYSALSILADIARQNQHNVELKNEYGTASFTSDQISFFRGLELVRITNVTKSSFASIDSLAKAVAETIDKGEADIPALVKHLPNPDQSIKTATFFTRFSSLQALAPSQSVLSVIETSGDADAAFVDSGSGKVLLIEYNTPQLATENDARVIAKIQELWKLGQPAPIGYRRVGNYSVFVFDSADNVAAKQLIDQVKYEQVVQWLGENPNILKQAEKQYVETTLGVFVAVLKASGFALIGCLGLGGLIGALLFSRRRAQQKTREAFSDAGGMLRLNIDELTPQTDPARLLGSGE